MKRKSDIVREAVAAGNFKGGPADCKGLPHQHHSGAERYDVQSL